MPGSMRRFSETQENPPPRRDATDRLHSTASDASLPDTSLARQLSQESAEYIPTRITKVAAPKPAANPLQFIKVGPASLYKSAQEQLKKVEEIKKVTKEDRDEPEEWQSNLDNWKSSRRKRQEHIIERVVEVKKFEMEDHDRNRRRSKTFSEMIEERNTRGGKANLVLYTDDDAHDLSDLGIGASGKSNTNEEFEHDVYQKENTSVKDRRKTVVEVCEKVIFDGHGKIGAVKSPPATPYIEVPSTRVVPLQEPEQLKQETVLLNDGVDSGEHVYVESYSFQHAPSDTSVLNVNVESITQEENNVFKVYNNVQQLPSSEFFSQHVPSDRKEEEKSLPFLNSLLPDDTEDVFLPVNGSQIPQLNLSSDVEIVSELSFPLGPSTSTEPPKEKPPPPPPEEISDDEMLPVTNLKRVDSTQRIKNELRRKRSDFLGIEGGNDDSYLEPELTVAPPPDMTTFLVEERRSEQQLYRQSICSETDSNHGETTSRDSGVELDRAQSDDWPGKLTPQILSAQHSRQNSDIYGTASVTSEEDEIMKREREILELLEKEEQWRYSSNTNSGGKGIGEKLTVKLLQLEQENKRLERARSEEENKRQMKENACREEDLRLRAKEQELKQQEEALQAERERLQRENEELQRQKQKLQHHEGQQLRHTHSQMHQLWGSTTALPQQWTNESTGLLPMHLSLQDISRVPTGNINSYNPPTSPMAQSSAPRNYRLSLPDLQQEEQLQSQQFLLRPSSMMSAAPHRLPPPIPPAKPLRAVSQEQRERENSIRNSRMPSADSVPQHIESTHVHHSSVPANNGAQPLSRQTLQALSAVPRSRFISNDMWMQAKKKPENQRSGGREPAYNYQHWLIQEAEHRRITEQQQRAAVTPRKTSPSHLYPNTPSWNTLQPQPRQEKPLPDAIIQTLTQRVQNRVGMLDSKSSVCPRRRLEDSSCRDLQSQTPAAGHIPNNASSPSSNSATACGDPQEKMLSVSGKKKCSHCGEELGRGAAMIIESLRLFYHIDCFKCCVCHVQLGDGLMGTDVRVRNNKLHCHNCYSSDDGVKFSCV